MDSSSVSRIEELISKQNQWRSRCINLIASENVTSKRLRCAMCSDFMHRYAEGHPGQRYYQGTALIDTIESQLEESTKKLFGCRHADVRSVSGTNANEAVFSHSIKTGDIVMVNSTPGGGHISHHKFGSVGKYTKNIVDFPTTPDGYHIDVEKTTDLIRRIRPKVLIFGKSLFLFPEPITELVPLCREMKIRIIYDAAHVLGLIAGGQFQSPLSEGAEIMTGSTHKTLFGTQRGVILSNLDDAEWIKVDKAAFPGSHSNHHLDTLAGLAIAVEEMLAFGREYAAQTVENAQALGAALNGAGLAVQAQEFGYTQSHQIAVDMAEFGGGKAAGEILERNNIIVNMNLLPFEEVKNVTKPRGIRIGVQEMTRMGMKKQEMERIALLMTECLKQGKDIRAEVEKFRGEFQKVHYSFD